MPRIAEDRLPAEPTSPEQRDRCGRILQAAAAHGAERGLERVQMHDIARDAGVAIATLYRYFPSKTHLFTGLLRSRVERLAAFEVALLPGEQPGDGIARLLVRAGEELLAHPLLAHAMLQSNNATVAQSPDAGVTQLFSDLMLVAGGFRDPDQCLLHLLGLVEEAWYGMLISALNRHQDPARLAEDTRLVCGLLLAGAPAPAAAAARG